MIDNLVSIASAEKDNATQDFLWGFVREQVEEEATAQGIVDKLKKPVIQVFCSSMPNWLSDKDLSIKNCLNDEVRPKSRTRIFKAHFKVSDSFVFLIHIGYFIFSDIRINYMGI